jgi:nucleotide-binding universal stress UspA family protein
MRERIHGTGGFSHGPSPMGRGNPGRLDAKIGGSCDTPGLSTGNEAAYGCFRNLMATRKRKPRVAGDGAAQGALELGNILVPIDFSPCSVAALDYAAGLARSLSAGLVLLHCVPPLHAGSLLEQRRFRRLHADGVQAASKALAKLAREQVEGMSSVKHYVREGVPAEVITKLATKTGCHLIVIGTHGHTGLKHALLGSVAERVVRLAHCPVLTVKG